MAQQWTDHWAWLGAKHTANLVTEPLTAGTLPEQSVQLRWYTSHTPYYCVHAQTNESSGAGHNNDAFTSMI
jgi:hypothetical protein